MFLINYLECNDPIKLKEKEISKKDWRDILGELKHETKSDESKVKTECEEISSTLLHDRNWLWAWLATWAQV